MKRRINVEQNTATQQDAESEKNNNAERRDVSVELRSLILTGAALSNPPSSRPPTIRLRYRGPLLQEDLWKKHVRVRITLDDDATFDCRVQAVDAKLCVIQITPREDNVNTALACASLCGRFRPQLTSVRIETTRNPHKYRRTFSIPEDLHAIN
ncbi:MAG: hypothetical protein AAB386_01700 [Patescibacteria group bacterium]